MLKKYLLLVMFSLITATFESFAASTDYVVKVSDMASKEEKTYKLQSLVEPFKIPIPVGNYNCSLSKSTIWKPENGGASLLCNDPSGNFGFSSYINCTDNNYISTQLMIPAKIEIDFRKLKKFEIPKELVEAQKRNLLVNSISIRVGCNTMLL